MSENWRMQAKLQPEIVLLEADLSDWIQVPERTLKRWRYNGDGPPFEVYSDGVAFYLLSRVKAWLAGLDELPLPSHTLRPAGARRGCR
jgi:hypothetical protein